MAQDWAGRVGHTDVAGLEKRFSNCYLHVHGTTLAERKTSFLKEIQ